MRITGGIARGQVIKSLPGLAVRPTTDKVREAIFNMIIPLTANWNTGLDLFAGTGALGLEALSREAGWIDFVDQNNKCCHVIKENLMKMGFSDNAHIYCSNCQKAISFLDKTYDFIFMDPPYANDYTPSIIEAIGNSKLINNDSIILVSHSSRNTLDQRYIDLNKIKEKKYGDTCISIYQKEGTT